jgi:serine/threonine-protein kinase
VLDTSLPLTHDALPRLEYTPKLTDFGLAKWLESPQQMTHTATAIGTPAYMAPEQVEGRTDQIGPRTDVYGLGATLYEALTGRPPFQGASMWETFQQIKEGRLIAPRQLKASVPADLEAICLKCLEHDRGTATVQHDS